MLDMTRRAFVGGSASVGVLAGGAEPAGAQRDRRAGAAPASPSEVATPPSLVVATRAGRVRGVRRRGIVTFKGIPYGRIAARFLPAVPPTPWREVRSAFSYGPICPQPGGGPGTDAATFYVGTPDRAPQGEDCLRINVWTPALDGRRPVLVWIHGGGFETGSAHEGVAYDGEAISRRGDLVVVSLNHRLGALGFLNLAAYDPALRHSANLGLLDIVAALRWVRDNIAGFGGDPALVTLMGQSGGGRKVSTLLAMPVAAGLFQRAIVHSGSLIGLPLPDQTAALAAATIESLGGPGDPLRRAREASPADLVAAFLTARRRFLTPTSTVFDFPYANPTMDGDLIPVQPFASAAPAASADVPMLIGTCRHEQAQGRAFPELVTMTDAELRQRIGKDYGERADEVIALFRHAYPQDRPFATLAAIESMTPRRSWAVQHARLKATQARAPAYLFEFAWRTPVLDGAPLAHHGADLPFALFNIDRSIDATGGGAPARRLAGRMSDAWIAFARTGDPNHSGLPAWPAVARGSLPTMIFDDDCTVADDHDHALRSLATVVPESLRHL